MSLFSLIIIHTRFRSSYSTPSTHRIARQNIYTFSFTTHTPSIMSERDIYGHPDHARRKKHRYRDLDLDSDLDSHSSIYIPHGMATPHPSLYLSTLYIYIYIYIYIYNYVYTALLHLSSSHYQKRTISGEVNRSCNIRIFHLYIASRVNIGSLYDTCHAFACFIDRGKGTRWCALIVYTVV